MIPSVDLAHLSAQIRQQESILAQLIEENNSLELSSLNEQFQFHTSDRPIALHNALVDLEADLFSSDASTNTTEISSALSSARDSLPYLQNELDDLEPMVTAQRDELQSILRQISLEKPPPLPPALAPPPRIQCSEDVERLAREWSAEMDEVSEDDLVRILARGPTTDDLLGNAQRLASLSFEIRAGEMLNNQLRKLIPRVDALRSAEVGGTEAVDGLADALVKAEKELQEITVAYEDDQDGDWNGYTWDLVKRFAKEVAHLREALLEVVEGPASIPIGMMDPETEKRALANCLAALRESTGVLRNHLQAIQNQGVVDTKIYAVREIRELMEKHRKMTNGSR
jgi:hypothetical protein